MNPLARFGEYAAAFEDVVKSDDWSRLEPFFAEDSVYEVIGAPLLAARSEGRAAVFAYLKGSLDRFDRRFETRHLELLDGPALRDGGVWLRFRASYRSPRVPELVFDGEETVTFHGALVTRLEDRYRPEMGALIEHWLRHYGDRLPPVGGKAAASPGARRAAGDGH